MLMEIRQRSPKTGTANSSHSGRITQHIHYGLPSLPFGKMLPSVVTLHMLVTLYAIGRSQSMKLFIVFYELTKEERKIRDNTYNGATGYVEQ